MTIRIRTKIIISFSAIFILLSFLAALSYYNRNVLYQSMLSLEKETGDLKVLSDLKLSIDMVLMPPNDYLITGDAKEGTRYVYALEEAEKGLKRLASMASRKGYSMAEIKGVMERFEDVKKRADEILSLRDPVGSYRGSRLMKEMDAVSGEIVLSHLDRLYFLQKTAIENEIALAASARKKVDMALLAGGALSVATAFIIAFYLLRSIIDPITKFKEGAQIIRGGNLSHRIDIRDGMEVNVLADEFNMMADRLMESHNELEKKVEARTRELNDANRRLKELSITDGLTGVYNQRHFYERLENEARRAARYGKPLSLIMADLDFFKRYNDGNGHLEGDNLLREIALTILRNVREQDIVSRYGGEEFAVIMPETDREGARATAERIRKAVFEQGFRFEERQPDGKLTISIGVGGYSDKTPEPKDMIREADTALYRAKELGRNRVEG